MFADELYVVGLHSMIKEASYPPSPIVFCCVCARYPQTYSRTPSPNLLRHLDAILQDHMLLIEIWWTVESTVGGWMR